MANEIRRRYNFISGTITDNPLSAGATTINSAALANLAAVGATEHAVLVLDPDGLGNGPEIVYVTAHTASATSATIARGQESTTGVSHTSGTPWVHAPIASDYIGNEAFTAYTPTLTATTTPPTLGTASSQLGVYKQLGRLVVGTARIVFGTAGVAAGSGTYRVLLPVAGSTSNGRVVGSGVVWDSSASDLWTVVATIVVGSPTLAELNFTSATTGLVTNAAPMTWAASDFIDVAWSY